MLACSCVMDYTDSIRRGFPRRGRGFRPGGIQSLSLVAILMVIIAVVRLIIAVVKVVIAISNSIAFLLSFLFPLPKYILAYSGEYVNSFL